MMAVEALNFGVGGYNTVQVAELTCTDVLAFDPDLVVYALHLNDFDFDDASGALIEYYERPVSLFLEWSRLRLRPQRRDGEGYYDFHFRLNRDTAFDEIARNARRPIARRQPAVNPVDIQPRLVVRQDDHRPPPMKPATMRFISGASSRKASWP